MGFFDLFKKKDKSKNKKYKMGLHKTREGALATLKEVLSKSSANVSCSSFCRPSTSVIIFCTDSGFSDIA